MSSRSRSYTPDRYLPDSEKYHRKNEDPAAGGPKRATTIAVGYDDHARGRDSRYEINTSAPRRGTSKTVAKRGMSVPAGKNDDSEWDTDYDPRDRLYLSPDEDSDSEYERRASSRHRQDSSRRESSRRHGDRHGDRHHDRRPRDRDLDHGSSHHSGHDHGHHEDRRSNSSSHSTSTRPRPARTASARGGRSHRYPPNSSRSDKPHHHRPAHRRNSSGSPVETAMKGFQEVPWEQVMKTAFKTGTITAIKVAHTPGSLLDKGAKVVSTSLAAAVIDTILTSKESKIRGGVRHAAIRHAAEMALGSMVVGPAVKGLKGK